MLRKNIVSVFYNKESDYNNSKAYLENLFYNLGLDLENYNKKEWNPLKEIISPGEIVLIKPNFVKDIHVAGGNIWSIMTHPEIIKSLCFFIHKALNGNGRIIIADAPQHEADFENILKVTGFYGFIKEFKQKHNFQIEVYDLRQERVFYKNGVIVERRKLKGDPLGYVIINLGNDSEFKAIEISCDKLRGADYDYRETIKHHSAGRHEYLVSKTVLSADVIISIPKLKTHKKAGVTLNIKNMVGILGDKNWMPHYRFGVPESGGDEYGKKTIKNILYSHFKNFGCRFLKTRSKFIQILAQWGKFLQDDMLVQEFNSRAGNWYGNDTVWRAAIDLNKIILYADENGKMQPKRQRKYFSIIDGIIAGEKNGPLLPQEKKCGLLIAGFDPLLPDLVATRLMGFDFKKIPILFKALILNKCKLSDFSINDILIKSNNSDFDNKNLSEININFNFKPSKGWEILNNEK